MKKILYNKYDKSKINTLPRVVFPGRIEVVLTEAEAEKAVDYLLAQPILGIDTETRPSFKKGRLNQVALLFPVSSESDRNATSCRPVIGRPVGAEDRTFPARRPHDVAAPC